MIEFLILVIFISIVCLPFVSFGFNLYWRKANNMPLTIAGAANKVNVEDCAYLINEMHKMSYWDELDVYSDTLLRSMYNERIKWTNHS